MLVNHVHIGRSEWFFSWENWNILQNHFPKDFAPALISSLSTFVKHTYEKPVFQICLELHLLTGKEKLSIFAMRLNLFYGVNNLPIKIKYCIKDLWTSQIGSCFSQNSAKMDGCPSPQIHVKVLGSQRLFWIILGLQKISAHVLNFKIPQIVFLLRKK